MFATRLNRKMAFVLLLALGMVPAIAAPDQKAEPSSLEKDPKDWIDMLSGAGA